jgi:hypothetical protein
MRRQWELMRAGGGVLLCAIAALVLLAAPARAGSIPYPHTDVMFVFDTSGSMSDALGEAQEEIRDAMTQIASNLPDVQYGLSEVKDYGGLEYDEENPDDLPWQLDVAITPDQAAVAVGVESLYADGGGDDPESYGRALWEAASNPTVGWRVGARHLIVLIADNVPHDDDLNSGIPENDWYEESPWDTGTEFTSVAGVPGSPLTPTTNLDWQAVLQQLAIGGTPLEFVDYEGPSGLLPYWENWAGRTGGQAGFADAGQLVTQLVGLADAGGTASVCASVSGSVGKRLLASLKCSGAMTWLEVKCGVELSITKALKGFAATKGLIEISKVKKKWRPLARIANRIKQAKFSSHAPKGFRNGPEALETLSKAKNVWDFVRDLRGLSKAVSPSEFRAIALLVGDVAGARSCVEGLLLAVE